MIKKDEITLEQLGLYEEIEDNKIYILPEAISKDKMVLNEYAPDIYKILKREKLDVKIIKDDNVSYLAHRDAIVVLPLIIGIPFNILSNYIYDWIMKRFDDRDIIKLRFVKKDNGKYTKIEIEGNKAEIKDILEELKGF